MTQSPRDPDDDIEARFAEIVAHWDVDGEEPVGRATDGDRTGWGPAAPRPPRTADSPADTGSTTPGWSAAGRPVPAGRPGADAAAGWRGYSLADPDEEPFEPPAPARLPGLRESPWFWVSLLGIGLGGLTIIDVAIFLPPHSREIMLGAIAAFVIGFAALVLRHSSRREEQDREGWEDDSGTRL